MTAVKRPATPLVGFDSKTKMEMFFSTACTDESNEMSEFVLCATKTSSAGALLHSDTCKSVQELTPALCLGVGVEVRLGRGSRLYLHLLAISVQ